MEGTTVKTTITVVEDEKVISQNVLQVEEGAEFLKPSDSTGPLAETLRQLASVYKQTNAFLSDIIVQQTGSLPIDGPDVPEEEEDDEDDTTTTTASSSSASHPKSRPKRKAAKV
eukprot:TRINITY_DN6885_c0_g1_i1.p1 TRINITY_DN6885_c0_g1~~TRINITY_DN6885_c0_g1_i1.p1  ORF type:complete len:114 (-),score=45.60 TRINITY_DN6885_c0_g1_i1:45-386(-)